MTDQPIRVAALYRFARFPDPQALRGPLERICRDGGVKGTLLLATEGINGTIAGMSDAIDSVVGHVRALPGCATAEIKYAGAAAMPFHRLKVRVKTEIVTMGQPVDSADAGIYVGPSDWNALIDDPDTIVIDTRNAYEVKVGTFDRALDPCTSSFRDFPAWFDAHRGDLAGKRVAMFCTGGIRCEKATAYLRQEGIADVFHLEGGILRYLEDIPVAESRWQGECFVFDERVAVGHGLAAGTHVLCRGCRMPVSSEDRASPLYREGVACPACHGSRDDAALDGYAERHRQTLLAAARGEAHVGATYDPDR